MAHAAVLCPSFYRADIVHNPTRRDRYLARMRGAVIGFLQRRRAARAWLTTPSEDTSSMNPAVMQQGNPIKIAILAMGGQGGGVLADWIVDMAEHAGWWAQTTSVPGVAQRTGATIYYLELLPESDVQRAGRQPALALMPTPGDVDLVVAAELMEGGRAIQRGLVTPERTVLLTSSHRSYAVSEKSAPGNGIADPNKVLEAGRAAAKRFLCFDLQALADRAGSVISASLFGAVAGSGALPFAREDFEATVRRAGLGVDASLRAFALGFESADQAPAQPAPIDLERARCRPCLTSPPAPGRRPCWTPSSATSLPVPSPCWR